MMILAANGGALGGHLAGWRHRDAYPSVTMQLDVMIETAKIAEAGSLDVIFLADGNATLRENMGLIWPENARLFTER